MASVITSDCINCGACASECPREAISEGDDTHKIDPAKCNECEGLPQRACAAVCPVDCIQVGKK